MGRLTRRDILKGGAMSSAVLITNCAALSELSQFSAAVHKVEQDALLDSHCIFEGRFDRPDIAHKPAYTIIADTDGAPRRLHTPSIIVGLHGVLIVAWSSNGPGGDEDPSNIIESSRSPDGGFTWSHPGHRLSAWCDQPILSAYPRRQSGTFFQSKSIHASG